MRDARLRRVLLLRRLKRSELFRRRFFLMSGFPGPERLAVDALARRVLVDVDAARLGSFAVPVGEAIATEAREYHQIDVLHVAALVQMFEQAPERGGFELDFLIAHGCFSRIFRRRTHLAALTRS